MTGQTLLDTMELLDQELQLQSGEADVTRGLLALNIAQDHLEAVIATERDVLGDTIGTVTTVANTETTAFPAGLLRLDKLQFIDPATSRPRYDLDPIDETGGHVYSRAWPLNLTLPTASPGEPTAYWTNGRNIYWDPLPDGVHTIRWYGFQAASDITAAGTFAYPDIARLPVASFAAKLMKIGVGDPVQDLDMLAREIFGPVIRSMSDFKRDGASGLVYTRVHTT